MFRNFKLVIGIFCLFILVNLAISQTNSDTNPEVVNKSKFYYKSPGLAMLLSAVIPGGGQFYTENYVTGALIAGAEGTLAYFAIKDHLEYQETNNPEFRSRRNNLLWWIATVKLLSIADAYVGANMYKFKEMMRLTVDYNRSEDKFSIGFSTKF